MLCQRGYDRCAAERDNRNFNQGDYRYFCAENYRERNYDYSTPTYENDYDTEIYDTDYENGELDYDYDIDLEAAYDWAQDEFIIDRFMEGEFENCFIFQTPGKQNQLYVNEQFQGSYQTPTQDLILKDILVKLANEQTCRYAGE